MLKQENGEALAIDKQEIETLVEVRSGETLALGGIFRRKQNRPRQRPAVWRYPGTGTSVPS